MVRTNEEKTHLQRKEIKEGLYSNDLIEYRKKEHTMKGNGCPPSTEQADYFQRLQEQQ